MLGPQLRYPSQQVGRSTGLALSIRVLHPFGAVLIADGIALEPLLDHAGISLVVYQDPDAWIPYSQAHAFLHGAMERSRSSAFGLRAARHHDAAQLQMLEYLAASSVDVGAALSRLVRYQSVATDASVLSLEAREDGALLKYRTMPGEPRCLSEFVIGSLLLGARRAAGEYRRGTLLAVWFEYAAPPDTSLYEELFGVRLCFEAPATGLLFRVEGLGWPMIRANPRLQELLEDQIEQTEAHIQTANKLTLRVETVLARNLEGVPMDLSDLARYFGLSKATLKRRLADEGGSYTKALDRVRERTAMRLLSDTTLSIGEVAFRTGYKDLSAFNRACRRWTGRSPSSHRKR